MEFEINPSDLAVIAIGGNLAGTWPSVQAALEAAAAELPRHGLEVVRLSRWWRSAAWPDASDPPFLNGVALARTQLTPEETLAALMAVERMFGRRRDASNAPRTLDLDLIAHGRWAMRTAELSLPHPRAAERLFVMGPLAEIAPDWVHPVSGKTAENLASSASIGQDARPL